MPWMSSRRQEVNVRCVKYLNTQLGVGLRVDSFSIRVPGLWAPDTDVLQRNTPKAFYVQADRSSCSWIWRR